VCVCVWVRVCMDIEGVIWRPSTCIRNSLPSTLHPSQSFHTRMHMCMHALIQTFTNPYNTQTNLTHKQPMQTQGTWWVHLVFHICRCCGLLQCVAVCCSVLQCVAVCCGRMCLVFHPRMQMNRVIENIRTTKRTTQMISFKVH